MIRVHNLRPVKPKGGFDVKVVLHGRHSGSAIATVGVWDPLLPAHRQLFKRLAKSSYRNNMYSLVVVIDPDPGALIWGRSARPFYDDLNVRLQIIKSCGVDAVLVLHFTKRDLAASAWDFFEIVSSQVSLGELWLGADQSLGNGPEGSLETIQLIARQKNIRLRILPELGVKAIGYQVRWFLRTGELRQATNLVGHPPLRSRPRSNRLTFAWGPGPHRALLLNDPIKLESQVSTELELVKGRGGLYYAVWPDRAYEYLSFIEGPGDQVGQVFTEVESGPEKVRLLAIAGKSASLYDRLYGCFLPIREQVGDSQVDDLLDRWRKVAANGDVSSFTARLAQEGHDLKTIAPLLGPVRLAETAEPPPWIHVLADCLRMVKAYTSRKNPPRLPFLDAGEPLPFEELFAPFIQSAEAALARTSGKAMDQLSQAALIDLDRSLLRQITTLAQQTLQLEYRVYKAQRQDPLDRLLSDPSSEASEQIFLEFVRYITADGMLGFFEEYCVLARLISNAIRLWIDTVAEFLLRFERDKQDLAQVLGMEDIGTVSKIAVGISDNHNGGRSVYILTLESGESLVYKPKNVELEREYAQLQHWLNEHGVPLPFRPLLVVPRYGYGWVEFAPHEPCNSTDGVARYFRRCGMLLCLIYVLEGTDCHGDNLVASGEYPQLIDLETLMHHHFQATEDVVSPSARALAEQRIWRSVLRTHFLPNWVIDKDGNSRDLGGLAGEPPVPSFDRSDLGSVGAATVSAEPSNRPDSWAMTNLPYVPGGQPAHASDYTDEIEGGFQQMYEFLLNHRELLLSHDGPLSTFAEQQVRFVLRPTETYSNLMQGTLHPDFLRDGIVRSVELDALSRIFVQDGIRASYWPVLRKEHEALEQLDVPLFTALAGETTLRISDDVELFDFFSVPSYPSVIDNIKLLSEADLSIQKQFIRMSFYAHNVQDTDTIGSRYSRQEIDPEDQAPLKRIDLIAEAVHIATHLARSAIHAPDGSVTWIALHFHPHVKRYQLRPIGYELYGGSAGIALFLAALARETSEINGDDYKALALAAIKPVRQVLPSIGSRFARLMGLGGFAGIGSIIYVLSCMSTLLSDFECMHDAANAALSVTGELVSEDTRYDIMEGSAGLLLALLSVYEVGTVRGLYGEKLQRILDLAVQCGDHLLNGRVPSSTGPRVWPTLDGKLFSGFSHGAAGIAYALLRLNAETGDTKYKVAACEAMDYERSIYVSEEENWPHFETDPGKEEFLMQWCHGAPGVALGRIAGLPIHDSTSIRDEIDLALAATARVGYVAADYLCCGNLGRARILLEGARQLTRPDLRAAAEELTATVIRTARKQANEFTLNWNVAQATRNPGFMRGLSGIGYTLLEMADTKQALPLVLCLGDTAPRFRTGSENC